MLNLAELYWSWRERLDEKRRMYNMYGKYMWQGSTLRFVNREVNPDCTQMFVECIESGLKSLRCDAYHCWAEFENGYKVNFWTGNKMYAYAQDSKFTSPTGQEISFNRFMPDKWCLYLILDKIENARI